MRKPRKPVAEAAAPEAPPKLVRMEAMKVGHEAAREEEFPKWKAALEAADGNVTAAARGMFPELAGKAARNRGNKLTRRLGLAEYAARLRENVTGHAMGRQDR